MANTNERALAPDLARGVMLLLIVLSNTGYYLWQGPGDSTVDRAVRSLFSVVLDLRIYPMFAFLIGYGMVQLYRRQLATGASEAAAIAVLRRRGSWMIVFGFAHGALLMSTDVVGTWGLLTLVLAGLVLRRGDGAVLLWCGVGLGYLTVVLIALTVVQLTSGGLGFDFTETASAAVRLAASDEPSYLDSVFIRAVAWPGTTAATLILCTAPIAILLGVLAARRRVLEEPGRHLRLLRWTAGAGIATGWLGGLGLALTDGQQVAVIWLHSITGLPGGIGYAAAFGLLAHRMSRRPRAPVVALAAVGKRSLSCYLTHSVLFAPLLAAWGLGIGAHLTTATMALFAIAVWLVTVLGAAALERAGRRGPAEVLLRRLIYR